MLTREHYIKRISERLAVLRLYVEQLSKSNLQDANIISEDIFRPILNLTLDLNLKNLNSTGHSEPGLDLGDPCKGVGFQITSERTSKKINHTLNTLTPEQKSLYTTIKVLIIGTRQTKYTIPLDEYPNFNWKDDIWDINILIARMRHLGIDQLAKIFGILEREIAEHPEAGGPLSRGRRRALDQHTQDAIRRGSEVSLAGIGSGEIVVPVKPCTHSIYAEPSHTPSAETHLDIGVPLSWACRRCQNVVVLGLPGSGKTTALRRLAAEYALDDHAPLPCLIHAPNFAAGLKCEPNSNPLSAIIKTSALSCDEKLQDALRAEIHDRLTNTGEIALIIDSIDECREDKDLVVEAIKKLRLIVTHDVEFVVSTRDSTYMNVAHLGFEMLTLRTPSDLEKNLESIVRTVSGSAAPHQGELIKTKVSAVVSEGRNLGGFFATPLVQVVLAILVSRQGLTALQGGRIRILSRVLDHIARVWEYDSKHPMTISERLSKFISREYVVSSFDQIAWEIHKDPNLDQEALTERLLDWYECPRDEPKAHSRGAVVSLVKFWDHAGIFVAQGSFAQVKPQISSMLEWGVARWLTSQKEGDTRVMSWLEKRACAPENANILLLSLGIQPSLAWQLFSVLNDRIPIDVLLTFLRSVQMIDENLRDSDLISYATDQLVQHRSFGDSDAWTAALIALFEILLPNEDAMRLLERVSLIEDPELNEACACASWVCWGLAPKTGALEDHLVQHFQGRRFVSSAAREVTEMVARKLVKKSQLLTEKVREALLKSRRIGHTLLLQLHPQLLLVDVRGGKGLAPDTPLARFVEGLIDVLRGTQTAAGTIFKNLASLSPEIVPYGKRRRAVDFCDFITTIVAREGATLGESVQTMLHADSARLLSFCARGGGFDAACVSMVARELSFQHDLLIWTFLMFKGRRRDLSHWPRSSFDEHFSCATWLLCMGRWGLDVAIEALAFCPDRKRARAEVESFVRCHEHDESTRQLAASMFLSHLGEAHRTQVSTDWAVDAEDVLRTLGQGARCEPLT